MQEFKSLSIIIPVFNEEDTIVKCIESLIDGDYPLQKLEFVIADGGSTDKTVQKIQEFSYKNPDLKIKVVDNPDKTQGYGLNIAIMNVDENSEIIIRVDAHSVYPRNYLTDCVKTLLESGADNAGGVMLPVGRTPLQKAVAFCMTHPIGVGNAKFHLGNDSGFVDTVYLGCFKKTIFSKIGLFDPLMTPNEDAEFNLRILKNGGRIYLNSSIKVMYYPRNTVKKLIIQYFRYGMGRCRTFKKHKQFTSYRQIIPPLWVITTLASLLAGFYYKLFYLPIGLYLFVLVSIAIKNALVHKALENLISPLCFVIMHYAWGTGFIFELMKNSKISKGESR